MQPFLSGQPSKLPQWTNYATLLEKINTLAPRPDTTSSTQLVPELLKTILNPKEIKIPTTEEQHLIITHLCNDATSEYFATIIELINHHPTVNIALRSFFNKIKATHEELLQIKTMIKKDNGHLDINTLIGALNRAKQFGENAAIVKEIKIRLANLYAKNKDFTNAIKIYLEILATIKDSSNDINHRVTVRIRQLLANFYLANNNQKEAIEQLRLILCYYKSNPHTNDKICFNTLCKLVDLYIQQKHYRAAQDLCLSFLGSEPDNSIIQAKLIYIKYKIAESNQQHGRYEHAQRYYLNILSMVTNNPQETKIVLQQLNTLYHTWIAQSKTPLETIHITAMIKFWFENYSLVTSSPENSQKLLFSLNAIVDVYTKQQNYGEAAKLLVKHLDHLTTKSDSSDTVKSILSKMSELVSLCSNDNAAIAIYLLEQIIKYAPDNNQHKQKLAALYATNKPNTSIRLLKDIIKSLPTNDDKIPQLMQQLVNLYKQLGNYADAANVWSEYLRKLDRSNIKLSNEVIIFTVELAKICLAQTQNTRNIISLLNIVVSNNPQNIEAIDMLISLYSSQEDSSSLISFLELAIKNQDEQNTETRLNLMEQLLNLYINNNLFNQAATLQQQILDILKNSDNKDQARIRTAMRKLAEFYTKIGEYPQAKSLLDEVIKQLDDTKSKSKSKSSPHELIVTTQQLNDVKSLIADGYIKSGQYLEASALFREVLDSSMKINGKEHAYTIAILQKLITANQLLADFYTQNLDYTNAIKVLEESIKSVKIIFYNNPKHSLIIDTAEKINKIKSLMVDMHINNNDYPNAIKLLQEILATSVEIYKAGDNKIVNALERLYQSGVAYTDLLTQQALNLDAVDTLNDLAAQQELNLDAVDTLNGLAKNIFGRFKFKNSKNIADKAQSMANSLNKKAIEILNKFATILTYKGNYLGVIQLIKRKLINAKEFHGEEAQVICAINNELASAYILAQNYESAETLLCHIIECSKRHGYIKEQINAMQSLALLCEKNPRRYSEACSLYTNILAKYHELDPETQGVIKLDTATIRHNLANLLVILKELSPAGLLDELDLKNIIILYQKALQERQGKLGTDHIDTARTMHSFGALYIKTGQIKEAQELLSEALRISNTKYFPAYIELRLAVMNTIIIILQDDHNDLLSKLNIIESTLAHIELSDNDTRMHFNLVNLIADMASKISANFHANLVRIIIKASNPDKLPWRIRLIKDVADMLNNTSRPIALQCFLENAIDQIMELNSDNYYSIIERLKILKNSCYIALENSNSDNGRY